MAKRRKMNAKRLAFTNKLLFETSGGQRFTQDSPILPDVWLEYALAPRSQQELILTVVQNSGTGQAAAQIKRMLKALRKRRPTIGPDEQKRDPIRISYIPGQIAVRLYFDELMRVLLPLTPWWHRTYRILKNLQIKYQAETKLDGPDWSSFPQPDKNRKLDFTDILMLMRYQIHPFPQGTEKHEAPESQSELRKEYLSQFPPELSWLIRVAGVIFESFTTGEALLSNPQSMSSKLRTEFSIRDIQVQSTAELAEKAKEIEAKIGSPRKLREDIATSFMDIYRDWSENNDYPQEGHIWRVTKNRKVHLAVEKSGLTVKADAARRVFDVSCGGISWAVLDSGIDRTHPAFKLCSEEYEKELRDQKALEDESDSHLSVKELQRSRIVKTLDFTRLRELLDYGIDLEDDPTTETQPHTMEMIERLTDQLAHDGKSTDDAHEYALKLLNNLRRSIVEGREISWQDLQPIIEVKNPSIPTNDHGTHVAGILGADWIEDLPNERELPLSVRTRRMRGICPDIRIIDVRVFREDGLTDEFELLAAIQYLRWMNSRAGNMQVHGVNLSLSLVHEVRRFACGQTPICDECNKASALGIVMVAAAGNRGFEMEDDDTVRTSDNYKSVSITDPANAEHVIAVGATHRKRPHEYGVSYFSSRGPTGDGRLKPDLVAPGEKIKGPTLGGRAEFKDGTSMAAPHVSGVAAMLMARHTELIGQPDRIKTILCETATDLGRERYFQGHGLVDALRALQSV